MEKRDFFKTLAGGALAAAALPTTASADTPTNDRQRELLKITDKTSGQRELYTVQGPENTFASGSQTIIRIQNTEGEMMPIPFQRDVRFIEYQSSEFGISLDCERMIVNMIVNADDQTYADLRKARKLHARVVVSRAVSSDVFPCDTPSYRDIAIAEAYVTQIEEMHPDLEVVHANITFDIEDGWQPVTA